MFARIALATAVLATTITAAAADGPRRLNGNGLSDTPDTTSIVRRPTGDSYLIITMEN